MVDESRIGVYNYIYNLLFNVVSDNVYTMNESQELTKSDTKDGFIVIHVGSFVDDSEFKGNAFAMCRVTIEAFVPPMSRGRLDEEKYSSFETKINTAINNEIAHGTHPQYSIQEDGVLSMDDVEATNANNIFYKYIKSFVVQIDN